MMVMIHQLTETETAASPYKVGYARVSTAQQSPQLQIDALQSAGCQKIYQEMASGAKAQRPQLEEMLAQLRSGDVLVVWKLDRLGRSLTHLVQLVNQLLEQDVGLQSLNDPIDTTSAQGRLMFNIFASLAEFERELIGERTQAGLKSARARGRSGGRPKGLSEQAKLTAAAAESLYQEGKLSVRQISRQLDISTGTLYSYLRYRGVKIGGKIGGSEV